MTVNSCMNKATIIALLTVAICVHTMLSSNCVARGDKEIRPATRPAIANDPLSIAVAIGRVDDGYQELQRINGRIILRTTSIHEVASIGAAAIPALHQIMSNKGMDFDTFARCYAACEEISENVAPEKPPLLWYGGADLGKTVVGVWRLEADGQLNVDDFRHEVLKDLEDRFGTLITVR